jgi:hypothetical protein
MPASFFELITLVADLVIFLFLGFYVFNLRARERSLEKKEHKVDSAYHHVVDDALSKERQIIDDATHEADQIVTGAQYINHKAKEDINAALQTMLDDIKKESGSTSTEVEAKYQEGLKQLTAQSLEEFHRITKELEDDFKKHFKEFHETMIPNAEKEIEEYKKARYKESEQTITQVIQKVSQDVLNKSLSMNDHQKLIIESLEKAKREGAFD